MLRLGRRGIILSLLINSLNITLYLLILVAACLNITEASVNFIILNAFAAFGCLVASPIAFNLYGGIIVVCMGIAFFMMSYVTLIPPLDGLVLNYKKLDRWKEQKHFRVQLEAQRIFEQQLQQEQNLARVNPVHHANAMTIHAHHAHLPLGVGSPKLQRTFGAGVGSANFGGAGHLAAMFSPPMSQSEHGFPHHQLQSRLHGSSTNFVIQDTHEYLPSSTRQNDATSSQGTGRRSRDVDTIQQNFQQNQRGRKVPPIVTSGLNDSPRLGSQTQNYILSPPRMRRQSITCSSPDSPALQYLPVGDDYSQDDNKPTIAPGNKVEWSEGDEKWAGSTGGDRILKTAPHPYNDATTRFGHPTLPLRTTNKPTPPHDPFRKTSISSSQSTFSNVTPVQDTPMTVTKGYKSPPNQGNKTGYQSLYQPPEPTRTQDKHPLQQHLPYYYSDPTKARPTNSGGVARYQERDIALTATGRILSSIGGMSGCYGIMGGLPSPGVASPAVPSSTSISKQEPYSSHFQQQEEPSIQQSNQSKSRQKKSALSTQQQQKQDSLPRIPETDYRQDGPFPPTTLDMAPSGPTRFSESPYIKNHRASTSSSDYSMSAATYMPDIVLTLPTPAEHGHGSRRDEYFGM
ncbi:hypothetical protein BGZ93_009812 [Podila epicladia]|nr:hypothetical protein BGZ92_004375 [Podila epicladia]KAG0098929.1 hypothetical protein BGZ93_009812 [Podila epicladia]